MSTEISTSPFTFRWQEDPEPYELGDAENEYPSEVLGCILDCEFCGPNQESLWGIGDPDNEYVAQIESDLSAEHIHVPEEADLKADYKHLTETTLQLTRHADLALGWLNRLFESATPKQRGWLQDQMPNNYSRRMLCQSIADAYKVLDEVQS